MKLNRLVIVYGCLVLITVFFYSPLSAAPPVLEAISKTDTKNSTFDIDIRVNETAGIAAAVFTVSYDQNSPGDLQLVDPPNHCRSGFFDQIDCFDNKNGVIMLSAAKKPPLLESGPGTIVTLTFQTSVDATGDYWVQVKDSYINDTAAGYTSSTLIPTLTGYDPGASPPDTVTYPEILASTSGSISGELRIDRDLDLLMDTEEILAGTDMDVMDSDGDGISDAFEDSDSDGYSNLRESLDGSHPGDGNDTPGFFAGIVGDDKDIDGSDLQLLAAELSVACSLPSTCHCDFNGDGLVDDIDLSLFLEDFGRAD